jgi:hypothetical protein
MYHELPTIKKRKIVREVAPYVRRRSVNASEALNVPRTANERKI